MCPNIGKRLKSPFESYRIPQLMVPWLEWGDILDKQKRSSRAGFHNEVLGLSYDSGTRPLTRQDIIDNCIPGFTMSPDSMAQVNADLGEASPVFAGIDWGCHDEETRTLTERGFKYYWEIDETKDRIAQYEPETGEVSYALAKKKIVFDHDGEMIHFKTNGQDLLVTTDHKIRYRTGSRRVSPWKEGKAQDVENRDNVRFPEEGVWRGRDQKWFVIAGQQIEASTWLSFLGFVISEGCIFKSKLGYKGIGLYQRDGGAVSQIEDTLADLPFSHRHRYNSKTKDHIWDINGPDKDALWEWLKENVGGKASKRNSVSVFRSASSSF
jgi:hypothetical protein